MQDGYIFQQLSSLSSLTKLYVFKYLMTNTPLQVRSASLKELDIDFEEFDEEGERVSSILSFLLFYSPLPSSLLVSPPLPSTPLHPSPLLSSPLSSLHFTLLHSSFSLLFVFFIFIFDSEHIYQPLNFSALDCPNLRRLRLSGLSLSPSLSSSPPTSSHTNTQLLSHPLPFNSAPPSSPYAYLFECLDSFCMRHLRHIQLELSVEQSGQKTEEEGEEEGPMARLHSTSLQRLSLDNYYADYFFNVSLDCPNMSSVYPF